MLFHPILKESVVSSLFTKSTVDKDQHSNYHPVSTLSLLSKITECVVTSNQAIASLKTARGTCSEALCGPWATPTPYPFISPFPYLLLCLLLFTFSFSYLLHLFSYFSIPSLSTRIGPLRFQAGGRTRQLNLGLAFCVICIFS